MWKRFGVMILACAASTLHVAAQTPAVQPFFFQIVLANVALMVVVHTWGAIRRVQPTTETIETFAWVALLVIGLLVYPG